MKRIGAVHFQGLGGGTPRRTRHLLELDLRTQDLALIDYTAGVGRQHRVRPSRSQTSASTLRTARGFDVPDKALGRLSE
ncbi:unnamed protein product [Gadus morhua 'NCC']